MTEEQEVRRGLSYSSFTEYSACARKYFLRKIKKVEIDSDADPSTIQFDIGKAMHKCLEDVKHDLKGFTLSKCVDTCKEFGIENQETVALVFSMLNSYKRMHEKTNLKVIACEAVIDVPGFYGILDLVAHEEGHGWWICDVKTSSSFQQYTAQTSADHVQLSLYAKHADTVAKLLGIEGIPFAGTRLRITTKSKLSMKDSETLQEYVARLSKGIKSYDIVVPADVMVNVDSIYTAHQKANELISKATIDDEENFPQNFSNCNSYFRSCEFRSRCFKRNISDTPKVKIIEA